MNWFYDKYFPGFGICLEVKKLLFSKKTKYQKIQIFQTKNFGRMLALDDDSIQLTEKDEFVYHEMMAHIPLFSLPDTKKVLIIGDGDGGVLREVLKHSVKEVYLVEIDRAVIEACQKYMPKVADNSFKDKRAKVIIADGAKIIKKFKNFFDLVIIGSPDPIGPGKILFSENFYKDVYRSLTNEGLMICQSGPVIFWPKTLYGQILKRLKKIFSKTSICLLFIPTYPGTLWSFSIGSKKIDPAKMHLENLKQSYKKLKINTKYYNPEIHLSSFILPNFLKQYEK